MRTYTDILQEHEKTPQKMSGFQNPPLQPEMLTADYTHQSRLWIKSKGT